MQWAQRLSSFCQTYLMCYMVKEVEANVMTQTPHLNRTHCLVKHRFISENHFRALI